MNSWGPPGGGEMGVRTEGGLLGLGSMGQLKDRKRK